MRLIRLCQDNSSLYLARNAGVSARITGWKTCTSLPEKGFKVIVQSHYIGDPADAIGRLDSMETVLRVLRRVTGLRIALVARVTDSSWTACAVLDEADFGLKPGDQLELSNTY